ncbi:MAG: laccase domain-containing protein [Desulfobacterales bacterium]|nr:MAG: laccase domain-containing protein [Desulfobacterales bacterium]
MINRKIDGVSFLQFSHLSAFIGVKHSVFTRHAGKSSKPFKSLNISFGIGDDERNVIQNRKIISRCIEGEDLIFMDQVHGTRVVVIARDNTTQMPFDSVFSTESNPTAVLMDPVCGLEPDAEQKLVGDALVTNISQKFIVVQVADCQSILLYDPVTQVVANVHSGWRGSIKNIISSTVLVMEKFFGCIASDIVAGISPSLGPCCSEFVNYKSEIPKKYWKYKVADNHFDFWSVSLDQLCQAGLLIENIRLSRICTKCNTDQFFSFRGEGTTGRFATLIGLT